MSSDNAQSALAKLVEEHYEFLYWFGYRLTGSAQDAEDLTQQTYLSAQASLDQLRDPAKARAWLVAILRNAFRRSRRRDASRSWVDLDQVPEIPAEELEELPVDSESLQAALNALPDDYREPVILFYLEDLSYRQIAETLDVPLGTVMSRLSRAKAGLRHWFRVHSPDSSTRIGETGD